MNDNAYNATVTILLILAILLVVTYFFKSMSSAATYRYYQPARAIMVETTYPTYQESAVAYSRPSTTSSVTPFRATVRDSYTYTSKTSSLYYCPTDVRDVYKCSDSASSQQSEFGCGFVCSNY